MHNLWSSNFSSRYSPNRNASTFSPQEMHMAPSWKQLKMSIDDRMDKYDWYIYTVEYYTTMKVNELLYHTMNKSYL